MEAVWSVILLSLYLISLKEDISNVEDGRQDPEDTVLVFGTEVKYFHGAEEPAEVLSITFASNLTVPTLTANKTLHK